MTKIRDRNCQRFITSEDTSGTLPPTTPIYFLCLDTKKVNKENSRLQRILGRLFSGLLTQYNSTAIGGVKQYCLLQALTINLQTFAYSWSSNFKNIVHWNL